MLLHGIGAGLEVWQPLIDILEEDNRVIAFDLLGFGDSPKPDDDWVNYNSDEHADAVIHSMGKLKLKSPVIIVGHSMGCLIAVQIAKTKPELVSELFLYEPPFYRDLPKRKSYSLQKKATYKIFNRILESDPTTVRRFPKTQKLLAERSGFQLSDETRLSFKKSLKNTIMAQTTVRDIKNLNLPITIIYGRYDRVVINDKNNYIFGDQFKNIKIQEIPASHSISKNAAQSLAKIIVDR